MPYRSFGTLSFDKSLEIVEKGGNKNKKRLQDLFALRQFCSLVNPSRRAFHPGYFLGALAQVEHLPFDFTYRAKFIHELLQKTYEKAMLEHLGSWSRGPLPNRINIDRTQSRRLTLIWTSSGNELQLTLTLYKGHTIKPLLKIVGRYENLVKERARLAGLPEPTLEMKKGVWHRFPVAGSVYPHVEKKESVVIVGSLLKARVPREKLDAFLSGHADGMVRLGDFWDFLRKYQR